MDLTWKAIAWEKTQIEPPALKYKEKPVTVVQISQQTTQQPGDFIFDRSSNSKTIETQEQWNTWLGNVPQPDSSVIESSLSIIICPRHPNPTHGAGKRIRNPASLKYLPFPSSEVFQKVTETFHIHQALGSIINRGWPVILWTEDPVGAEPVKKYFHFRCSNDLDKDIALSITVFPEKKKVYAIFFGCESRQVEGILGRLEFAAYAVHFPFTLISIFLQLEKAYRFEQVEGYGDAIIRLIKNFQLGVTAKENSLINEDDPLDLVGLSGELTLLKNGLVSWVTELRRLELPASQFPVMLDKDPKFPLLNAPEYLKRTIDEYNSVIRKCDKLLSQVSMTFQMETSSIARQEAGRMKALAILTMFFLPATFVSTFMSMGLFDWHQEDGSFVASKWWYAYPAIVLPLTLIVLGIYYFWTPIVRFFFGKFPKLPSHMV